ncbi:MAG: hypothetical protein RIB41_10175 [Oceanibaculum nanhaiense]|uniref:hypothetical protein n=1 Tax=Oceanibaculum nanhaiense TaxID=1909734 RepID=UPI0032EDA246
MVSLDTIMTLRDAAAYDGTLTVRCGKCRRETALSLSRILVRHPKHAGCQLTTLHHLFRCEGCRQRHGFTLTLSFPDGQSSTLHPQRIQ